MSYVEIILDSATAFQSSVPGSAPTDTPQFDLGQGITNIHGAKVVEAVIPFSWYNWTTQIDKGSGSPMNQIIFASSTGDFSQRITIPPGNYTAPQLAAFLDTYVKSVTFAAQMATYNLSATWAPNSVVYNAITGTIDWTLNLTWNSNVTTAKPLQIFVLGYDDDNKGRSQQASLLGFQQGDNLTNTFISSNLDDTTNWTFTSNSTVAQCTGPNYLYICSKTLGPLLRCSPNQDISIGQNNLNFISSGYSSPETEMIPINANPGGVIIWQDPYGQAFDLLNLFQLQKFDMYISLGPYVGYAPLKLNGLSFQVKLKLILASDNMPMTQLQQTSNQLVPTVPTALGSQFNKFY